MSLEVRIFCLGKCNSKEYPQKQKLLAGGEILLVSKNFRFAMEISRMKLVEGYIWFLISVSIGLVLGFWGHSGMRHSCIVNVGLGKKKKKKKFRKAWKTICKSLGRK